MLRWTPQPGKCLARPCTPVAASPVWEGLPGPKPELSSKE